MKNTSIGTLLINRELPESLRRESWQLDKKGIANLMREVAEKHPDQYADIEHRLEHLGSTTAWNEGATISVSSLLDPEGKRQLVDQTRQQVEALHDNPQLSEEQRDAEIVKLMTGFRGKVKALAIDHARKTNDPVYLQARSGSRGSEDDINLMRGADALAVDQNDRPIPLPIFHSYGEGQDPAEYWAGTYAQRKGILSVKRGTADAGFLAKQLSQAAHRQVVTHEKPDATRLPVGLPVSPKDLDNVGAVLAKDAGPVKAGTILTAAHLQQLERDHDEILVHSPLTDITPDGGVSQWSVGKRTRSGLNRIGDNAGLPAAQAISEKLSQGLLSSKHSVSLGSGGGVSKSGFEYLNRLLQGPEEFPEAGPLSEEDGTVDKIDPAPQGGHYIHMGEHKYYAHPGIKPVVKAGQRVEQGDDLTDGTPHPADLVRLRGLGEARKVYAGLFQDALKGSGVSSHRRNVESVTAGLLNWGQVTDPDGLGDHLVDDIVPIGRLQSAYKPREDAKLRTLQEARGHYLEEPALHYTVGTRIGKRAQQQMAKHGIKDVLTHEAPPPYRPYFNRALLANRYDKDWATRLSGFYSAGGFSDSLWRGDESDPNSTSYVPALARGTDFGKDLATKGTYGSSEL